MRIVVLGYIVRGPLGGLLWHNLQYVLGLKEMGHSVLFLEDSDDFAGCYNPETFETSEDPSYGLKFIKDNYDKHGIGDNWAYYDAHTNTWYGKTREEALSFCATADVVLNVSGVNAFRDWWLSIPNRILIDTDPVFTQVNHLTDSRKMHIARSHTHYATYGENFGQPGCSIPDDGFDWKPTRQPLCSSLWKYTEPNVQANWTTVMQWDSYKQGEYNGKVYGMKSTSFEEFVHLPKVTTEKLELALGSPHAPREILRSEGWIITDPLAASLTADDYRHYLSSSKGEWSIAKHGYVSTNSGWFSERSVHYMASGRPVVLQDTGFSSFLPTGKGLMCFNNPEEAADALKEVNADYVSHCNSAREIAIEYFDATQVLQSLLSML